MIGCVLDLRARRDLDDLENVELGGWVFLTLHHENILEALVVLSTILGRAIAKTVELEAFQSLYNTTRIEGAGTLTGIRIEQG